MAENLRHFFMVQQPLNNHFRKSLDKSIQFFRVCRFRG